MSRAYSAPNDKHQLTTTARSSMLKRKLLRDDDEGIAYSLPADFAPVDVGVGELLLLLIILI